MKIFFNKIRKFAGFAALFMLMISCSNKKAVINDGQSNYKIFVAENATLPEKLAARELQKYLNEMSSCKLPIVHNISRKNKVIYVGFRGALDVLMQGLRVQTFGGEEFIIRQEGDNILIAGGEPRGTLYGVIGLLDTLGCRWYTREVVKIPKRATVYFPDGDIRQKPAFEYRESWYKEAYDAKWAMHNRLNPSIVPVPDSLGGSYITYPFVHTFYRLVPPEKYFKKHPEYFSLVDGKRKGHEAQLCLTNPDVVKIATQTVFRWIKEHPRATVFTVDQNDGYGYCECEQCKKVDEAEGSHSGTLIRFVNQIADSVAKVYPHIKLQTLAYVYTEAPPKHLRPADNVTIRMCHYNYCSAHAMMQCSSHKPFIERLEAWKKIAKRITIWDYFTDYARYLLPYPNFERVVNDVRFYADNSCIGLFAQGSNVPDDGGGEFGELRAWVFARLMWNPNRDGWKLVNEFIDNVYGPSAPFIHEYIAMLQENVKPQSVYFSIFAEPTDGGYLTPQTVHRAEQLFAKAEKAAADRALLKRVELAHLPVLYSRLFFYSTGGKAFLTREEMPAVLESFERIIREHKITRMAERVDIGDISAFVKRVKTAPDFITDWQLIGPFDNPDGKGLITPFAPEKEFNSEKEYSGYGGETVRWQTYKSDISGYIDFTKIFKQHEDGVAYAYRDFKSEENKNVNIGIGSNDGVRMWLNGKLVLDNQTLRKAEPKQDMLTLSFKKGDNKILMKVDQFGGGWGFYFSILD